MATNSGAASRVFAIPELLESILLFSALPCFSKKNELATEELTSHVLEISRPPQDLIECYVRSKSIRFILTSALRINKFWNTVINDSVKIQEILFFRWSGIIHSKEKPVFNPLLVTTFTWGYFHSSLPLSEKRDKKIRKSIIHKHASWRRMFPVVPPIKDVSAHREDLTAYWDYDQEGKISLGDGFLYMGLLFDIVEEATTPADTSTFNITWYGSIDMSSQSDDFRKYCDKYKLHASLKLANFSKPNAMLTGKMVAPIDATAVNSVRILMTNTHPRRWCGDPGQSYPKLESKGKEWHLSSVEWGEFHRSK